MLKIEISGIEEAKREILKALTVSEPLKRTIAEGIIRDLKAATPVDTGAARDSWRYVGGRRSAIVNDKEYIKNLNEGSSKQAPARFIEMVILKHTEVKPVGSIVTYNDRSPADG